MKIAFIYSEKYTKYEKLIDSIMMDIGSYKENSEYIFEVNTSKATRKKYDLYVVFSDDKEDFDNNTSKLKLKPILITSNLNAEYITYTVTKVVDIIYSKNNVSTIINRINESIKRLKCLKD